MSVPAKNPKLPKSVSNRINGKLGGRPKGAKNKTGADIRLLAQQYAPAALAEIGRLSKYAESEGVRVKAGEVILDRAYGRAPQPFDGDGQGGPIVYELVQYGAKR